MSTIPTQIPPPTDPADPAGDAGNLNIVGDTPVVDAHGKLRNKRIWLALFFGILTKPLALLISVITVPLFLRYLGGQEGYGLFEVIASLVTYLAMINVGLPMGLGNKLIVSYVNEDKELTRRQLSTAFVTLALIAIVAAVAIAFIAPMIDWRTRFAVKGSLTNGQIAFAIWVAGAITVLGFISALPQTVYFARQEMHRGYLWDGAAKLMTLIACVVVVYTNFGLVGVVVASMGSPILIRLINGIVMIAYEKPWIRPRLRLFDLAVLKDMMREGVLLFLLGSSSIILFQMDKLVIGMGAGSEHVAGYSVIGRIFIADFGIFATVMAPLWAAHGEAARRGDIAWVKRWLWRSALIGCGSPLAAGAALLIWGDQILHVFLRGQKVDLSASMIVAIALAFTCRAWVDCRSVVLNSIGVIAPQLPFYVGHAILNLGLSIVLVRKYGATGVAWSLPITGLVTSVWGYPWLMRKYVYSRKAAAFDSAPA